MIRNMAIGGGDPEGVGFFRSVTGSYSSHPSNTQVTVECGFAPKALIGTVTAVSGTSGYTPLHFFWSARTGGVSHAIVNTTLTKCTIPVSVGATSITFAVSPETNPTPRNSTFNFEVFGVLPN